MHPALLVVLPLVLLTAACSSTSSPSAASPTPPTTVTTTTHPASTTSDTVTVTPSESRIASSAGSVPTCHTSQLSVRLGKSGGAAGTIYYPILFTNQGRSACALRGYPGASFVAPTTGRQVGAAASRKPQQPVRTILIVPASSASAQLGIADYQNYLSSECLSHPVSGLHIFPPGNTTAAFVPFKTASAACSTRVHQLGVAAVVTGSTGQ